MSTLPAVDQLDQCWASLDELLDGLSADQWATQSLCPAWTVRGVLVHLAAIEHMLLGEAPGSMADALPFAKAGEWIQQAESLTDAELLAEFREIVAGRRAELATMTQDDFDQPCMTPVGPGTYGRFMDVRVFDHWVHEQDIRVPLGLAGHESGAAAETAVREVEISLGYIVGKKIGLPDGRSLTIELNGPVERTFHVNVDGRARQVESLDTSDVVLTTDSTTFALLACGRIDPQGPIDDGDVSWSGDDEWGERAARNLAFTM